MSTRALAAIFVEPGAIRAHPHTSAVMFGGLHSLHFPQPNGLAAARQVRDALDELIARMEGAES